MLTIQFINVIISFSREFEYYDGNRDLPIYEVIPSSRRRLYSAIDILQILLNPKLRESKVICNTVPISIQKNVAFVVDTSRLEDPSDILADDMGVWKHNGVDTGCFEVSISSSEIQVEKKGASASGPLYTVKRVYRVHGTNRCLKKLTAYIMGRSYFTLLTYSNYVQPC